MERLAHGKLEGPPVTLAYMADDKAHVCALVLFFSFLTRAIERAR